MILKTDSKYEYFVSGMHCPACELIIEKKLEKSGYIKNVNAVLNKKKVYIEIESDVSEQELLQEVNSIIRPDGYTITETKQKHPIKYRDLAIGFAVAAAVVAIFFLIQKLGIANIIGSSSLSLSFVFLIGVVASLSSCMAVVGGLVLSISSSYAQGKNSVRPLIIFHMSRIAGFFLLGGLLGMIGIAFSLTPNFYFIMGIILFIVMIVLGINLLDIFPFFHKLHFRMPKKLSKKIINSENIGNKFMPLLLGTATFFLPCGFTQSMQMDAMTSGSFLKGAMVMLVFALGTLPVLALISFSSVRFAHSLKSGIFFKTAGFIVIFFAVFNFIFALVAAGVIRPVF
ncbi:MAG: sulfite exporter TauE/SafE family protein [Actinobacteria bacterium]|nr:sulfite exporter TauE/SafE family protein [Actinomycetota bacterium]